MKARDLREMTNDQLRQRENELGEAILNLRIQASTGALDDVHAIRHTRRNIARIKTVLRERELEQQRKAE